MIITRKKKIPLHWVFYAQIPLLLSVYGDFAIHTPFLLLIKRFIDNPAAIMGLISLEIYITFLGGPLLSWLSDRIWTRWGRRKHFLVIADLGRGLCLLAMPFAPNLITLILIRWLYGALSDFGSMTQALIYEIVPAPQRGRLSGFFQSSVQLSNIVFYFLLIGRFDDHYFMGPFDFLGSLTGGAIMFVFAAMILVWVAFYEGLAIKEIKPPDAKTLSDGRKPKENVVAYFFRTFVKDVLGKDFLPLYLLMFINTMFGVGLGIFQPLLYTDQWGYSLQEMGTNIAIGAVFSIAFALASGWFADRYGKLATFTLSVTGSLVANVAFTLYVYFLPDQRPSLTELVVFGNIHNAFNMVKAVVVFPLIMQYVKRNRMGAANAGIKLFGALFRNTIVFFVGLWLAWWSAWFLPQAGYHLTATFSQEIEESDLRAYLGDPAAEELTIRPAQDLGHTGHSAMKWWIHRNDERTGELLKREEKLKSKISELETKQESPFLSADERQALQEEYQTLKAEVDGIQQELEAGADQLKRSLLPQIQPHLFPPGRQILQADLSGNRLQLELLTISQLEDELFPRFVQTLDAPQYELIAADPDSDNGKWEPNISPRSRERSVALTIGYDPSFLALYSALSEADIPLLAKAEIASTVISVLRMELGRGPSRFALVSADLAPAEDALDLTTRVRLLENALKQDPTQLALSLEQEKLIQQASATARQNGTFDLTLSIPTTSLADRVPTEAYAERLDEAVNRAAQLLPDHPSLSPLVAQTYLQIAETLASPPFHTSVPENYIQHGFQEREYEYFFSSKTLELATDLVGFLIIALLIYLERRGKIHRYGVEEDLNR